MCTLRGSLYPRVGPKSGPVRKRRTDRSMKHWSPNIDSDEWFSGLATDWRILRESSPDCAAATRAIVAEHAGDTGDETPGPIFWMSLARLQWLDGCLHPSVRRQALRHIQRGAGSVLWLSALPDRKRQAQLDRLGEMLRALSPASKPFGGRPLARCPVSVGSSFRWLNAAGRVPVIVVVRHRRHGRRLLAECVLTRPSRDASCIPLGNRNQFGEWNVSGRDAVSGRPCSTILVPDIASAVRRGMLVKHAASFRVRVIPTRSWPEFVKLDELHAVLASMQAMPKQLIDG